MTTAAQTADSQPKTTPWSDAGFPADLVRAIRSEWRGVHLEGRTEHGARVALLPHRSIELEQDGDYFLTQLAEQILSDAEAKGFRSGSGNAVIITVEPCWDDGWFSHYEYTGISPELTALFYGTAEEQNLDSTP